MRQGRAAAGQRKNKCLSRRVAPPLQIPPTASMDDPSAPWKGPPGPPPPPTTSGGGGGGGGPPPSQGPPPNNEPPSSFPQFQGGGAGSPQFGGGGPPPGSTTPQYAASPAPSGSSTPGPFPPPPPGGNSFPPGGPFGSPNAAQLGRVGPPFMGGGGGGPPHFGGGGGPPPPFQGGGGNFGLPFGGPPSGGPPGGHHPGMGGPMGMPPMGMNPGDRMDQGSLPVPRRHTPYFGQPDYRVYELNKRLQQRTEESDNLWWDAFATEFFEDDASLTLAFCLEDGPKRYTIGRTLIPRYFRSIFEGGVTELYYNLRHPKESFHNTSITLDCDGCTMVTHHGKPLFTKVCTEGRLILEFTFDDLMRIKSWHFAVRTHRELIPRSVVGMHSQQDVAMLEQLSKNITRQGITNPTLNYLRLCVILEPMQELMSRHKAYALSPRDCLKTTLFQKWQKMVAPPEAQRPANKRRKRKGSNSGGAGTNSVPPSTTGPNKKRSPGPNFSLASQDVMVVGEPSLMGGEFGDEDERLITRLENTQYDASTAAAAAVNQGVDHHDGGGPYGGGGGDSPWRGGEAPPTGGGPAVGGGGGGAGGQQPGGGDGGGDKKSPAVSQ